MKLHASLIIVGLVVGLAFCIGYISTRFLENDNPIEQCAEEIIDNYTGIEVDLSPDIIGK